MFNKYNLQTALLFYILISIFYLSCNQESESKALHPDPNIIVILVDDLGWKDLECYGSTFHETPNLNSLAKEGTLFTNAYAASPVCSPTRAAILTGKYPSRVNITDWIPGNNPKNKRLLGPDDANELALKEMLIPEILQEHGYKTFFAGKWHLGNTGYFPENQGFDVNKGGHHMGQPPNGYYTPYKNPKLEDGPEGEYLTDRLTDESIRFIEKNRNEKFFLYLSYYTVHTPIEACKRHIDYYIEKSEKISDKGSHVKSEHEAISRQKQSDPAYASMVHALDENVGRLLRKVDSLGIAENTAIIFTSDNGGLTTLPSRVGPTSVTPLRAGKGWCYEGGIRVPLIVKIPWLDQIETTHTPAISMDLFPSILDLTNTRKSSRPLTDGNNLIPALSENFQKSERALFWHFPHYHGSGWTPGSAIRWKDWKLIRFYHHEKEELYDLGIDVGEQVDLSREKPDILKYLGQKLDSIQLITNAQLPGANPDHIVD